MSEAVLLAIIAIVGTLLGGLGGALLEPLKLRFGARARSRQERAERCARLVVAAQDARDRTSDMTRIIQATRAAGRQPDPSRLQELSIKIHETRKELRICVALVSLSGPDDLAAAAERVRIAEEAAVWPGTSDQTDDRLAEMFERYDSALAGFVEVARKQAE